MVWYGAEEGEGQTDLGGKVCQRISRGLGSQGRGAGQARDDLDDAALLAVRVERVLYVTLYLRRCPATG